MADCDYQYHWQILDIIGRYHTDYHWWILTIIGRYWLSLADTNYHWQIPTSSIGKWHCQIKTTIGRWKILTKVGRIADTDYHWSE